MKKFKLILGILAVFLLVPFFSLKADDILLPQYDWKGSRSTRNADQMDVNSNFTTSGLSLSWNVTQNTNGTFHYLYTLTPTNRSTFVRDFSYISLSTSSNLSLLNYFNVAYNLQGATLVSLNDTGLTLDPIDLNSLKSYAFSFDSAYSPIWGSFYATDNRGAVAYNDGLVISEFPTINSNFAKYIAVPGSSAKVITTPEPSTYAILFSCLALALFMRKKREKVSL